MVRRNLSELVNQIRARNQIPAMDNNVYRKRPQVSEHSFERRQISVNIA